MSDVSLYGLAPSSYVRSARMICAAKGISHTLTPVDFRSPEYRAHHPFNNMPAFEHGAVKLYEVLAIGVYVDEQFEGPALQPATPQERALMMQWISAINDYYYTHLAGTVVRERIIMPMRGETPDEAKIKAALPHVTHCLDVCETALTQGPYLCGSQVTLADFFMAPLMAYFAATPEGKDMLPKYTALSNWHRLMEAQPDYRAINAMG